VNEDAGISFDPNNLTKMRDGFKKLLHAQWEKSPPIFVFEEAAKISELEKLLEGSLTKDTFVIETISDDPEPILGWDAIKANLNDLGVKLIVIGGMNLRVRIEDYDYGLRGCVPLATFELAKNFELKMSQFLYPLGKDVYKDFEGPTGPNK